MMWDGSLEPGNTALYLSGCQSQVFLRITLRTFQNPDLGATAAAPGVVVKRTVFGKFYAEDTEAEIEKSSRSA